jgi:hypothetical protein
MHDVKDTRDAITKGMQMTLLAGFLGWMMDGLRTGAVPHARRSARSRAWRPPTSPRLGAKAVNGWVGGWMGVHHPRPSSWARPSAARPSAGSATASAA